MGPLTFTVRGSTLHGSIPAGWFAPASDTLAPALVAWLVSDDYSSSISLREILLDATASRRVEKEGMKLLATLSLTFREDSTAQGITAAISAFTMNGVQYGRYESSAAGFPSQIIVFVHSGKYYECEAVQRRSGLTDTDMQELRRAQAAVLFSLTE